jgi:hypothetical protein
MRAVRKSRRVLEAIWIVAASSLVWSCGSPADTAAATSITCFTLDCQSHGDAKTKACVTHCSASGACSTGNVCIHDFGDSCFASCDESPTLCAYGFDCVDYDRTGHYTCLPAEWVASGS